jgi:WD repeat and SOF domain-containing protein 1
MKIKMLCRNPADYIRETKKDIVPIQRNYDPDLHPFETAREYTRAMNAVKMDRIFARPFICSLDGHRDSVQCLTKHSTQLSLLLSGSCDGEVREGNEKNRILRKIFL